MIPCRSLRGYKRLAGNASIHEEILVNIKHLYKILD